MTLEHHVTSLELSRTLKELGVPQTAHFTWKIAAPVKQGLHETAELVETSKWNLEAVYGHASAFLTSELGEMLPKRIKATKPSWDVTHELLLNIGWDGLHWFAAYYGVQDYKGSVFNHTETADTEPDARAKLLIHLIEQGIVDPKKL